MILSAATGRRLAPAGAIGWDDEVWRLRADGDELEIARHDWRGAPLGEPLILGGITDPAIATARTGAPLAIVCGGGRAAEVRVDCGELVAAAIEPAPQVAIPIAPRAHLSWRNGALRWRDAAIALPAELTRPLAGAALPGPRAAIAWSVAGGLVITTIDLRRGAVIAKIRCDGGRAVAFLERRGRAIVQIGDARLIGLDLRTGRPAGELVCSAPIAALGADPDDSVAVLGEGAAEAVWVGWGEMSKELSTVDSRQSTVQTQTETETHTRKIEPGTEHRELSTVDCRLPTDPPLALGEPRIDPAFTDADRRAWIGDLFALVAAWTQSGGARSERELAAAARFHERWDRRATPLSAIAAELALSPLAIRILLVAAGPLLWGELARDYRSLADDPARPLVDELLVARILGVPREDRAAITRELDDDAPLVRSGAIALGPGTRPFAALVASRHLLARMVGSTPARPRPEDGVELRPALRDLDELAVDRAALAELLRRLARPTVAPARLVLCGVPGAGRRTLAAALAARLGRQLGVIRLRADLEPAALAARLRDVALRGWLPCLVGADDHPRLGELLDHYPDPVILCAGPAARPALGGDPIRFELARLGVDDRAAAWRRVLAEHGLPDDAADQIAVRQQVPPGAAWRAALAVAESRDGAVADLPAAIDVALRRQRDARLDGIAERLDPRADWSRLVLPPETLESLRELCSRVRHRATVMERWGMAGVVESARGVTAMLQGAPGTGKTLIASVLARELGHELYRVDVSRITSKWVGETEQNLATLFDAAAGGDVILLFDEADSLFARRTEVRSATDRHANSAVNFLLQKLDSFEGIAILTTNFGASIDRALLRRLSFRLTLPLPDEQAREALWRVHIPDRVPVDGELGRDELAARYHITGGYIRNAVLRATFLAAREDKPLSADLLERAVRCEYREMGKLHDGGPIE